MPTRLVLLVCAGLLASSWASDAQAIPRYSARYQQDCHLCHTNPTGGGQRTTYASQFLAPTELAARFLEFEELEGIDPQLNDQILIGADVRTLYAGNDGELRGVRNFFQMQSDLYLSIRLDERYNLYLDRGANETLEVFGLAHVLPWNGYAKVGRFTPAFGWKIADHTAVTRQHLGLFPPAHTDTGLELGVYPGDSALHVSVTNGSLGNRIDNDDGVAVIGRGVHRRSFGPIHLGLGASYWFNDLPGAQMRTHGVFGYAHLWRFTYTGEWDGSYLDRDDGREVYSMLTAHELATSLRQGVDLLLTYGFREPDVDFRTGVERRYGAGLEVFLHHFLQVSATFNHHNNDQGAVVTTPDYNEVVLQAHFLY